MHLARFLINWLLWTRVTEAHKWVGRLVTSVSYGHIHAFLSTDDARARAEDLERILDGVEDSLLTAKEKRNLARLKAKNDKELLSTREEYNEFVDAFSPVTNNTVSAREKRSPLLIVAAGALAAVIVVNLGLSIANRVELEMLQDTVEIGRAHV